MWSYLEVALEALPVGQRELLRRWGWHEPRGLPHRRGRGVAPGWGASCGGSRGVGTEVEAAQLGAAEAVGQDV